MIDKKTVYVIIPARGGSKRLHRKNIYPVLGKPMLHYSIAASRKSQYVDKIFVSSEDKEILNVAKNEKAIPVKRSVKNSQDHVFKQDAIVECLDAIKEKFDPPDIIISLQANSPEVKSEDLDKALEKFVKFNRNELMSFNPDLIQNAAFRIMIHDSVYQKTLSTKCGCFVTDYIDVHTRLDVEEVEKRLRSRVS